MSASPGELEQDPLEGGLVGHDGGNLSADLRSARSGGSRRSRRSSRTARRAAPRSSCRRACPSLTCAWLSSTTSSSHLRSLPSAIFSRTFSGLSAACCSKIAQLGLAWRPRARPPRTRSCGAGGRDVQRDVARELQEVVVARDEVGLAVDLDEHADLAVGVDVALRPCPRPPRGRRAWPPCAWPLTRRISIALLDVAARPPASALLAVHHPRAGAVAEGLDVLRADRGACGGPPYSVCGLGWGSGGHRLGAAPPRRLGGGRDRSRLREPASAAGVGRRAACGRVGAASAAASAAWRRGLGLRAPPLRPRTCAPRLRPSRRRERAASAARRLRALRLARLPPRPRAPPAPRPRARARSSASRRACSSASRARLLLLGAEDARGRSATTSPIARVISAQERIASSLPGIT